MTATRRTRGRVVRIHPVGRSSQCLHGANGAVRSAALSHGIAVMSSVREPGAILVQDAYADDLLVALERRGWTVEVTL